MRRALMGLIMAATVLTPIAAEAQTVRTDRADHYRRLEQRNQQRHQARQERRAARAESSTSQGETQQSNVARERSHRAQGDRQRSVQAQPSFQRNVATAQSTSQAWQGDPDDPRRAHYERLERRNQQRYGTQSGGSHDHDTDQDSHREVHRDLNREDRELHRSDPTRREHREWHRDAQRDHRQIHRDTHRDLHASDPTRREHRQWHREWDRSWRHNSRYDWASWRWRNRNLFHLSPYYSPYRDWSYRRFSIGLFMPSLFYGQRYWINDPWYYRLPPAPPGTRWIRYYDDVLLVDTWSGEVIDVIHNFFW